ASEAHILLLPLQKTSYERRANAPSNLIITRAAFIMVVVALLYAIPGIWSDEQTNAWEEITDAIHSTKSCIFLQVWAPGRAAMPEHLHVHR
ncbi:hypothetical protein BKA70DRAFT_1105120, partial [Coprinopsis sp. MPI-PUGE-AT-0042]